MNELTAARVSELYRAESERFRRESLRLRSELSEAHERLEHLRAANTVLSRERDELRARWNELRVAVARARRRVPRAMRDSVFVLCHPDVRTWLNRLACSALGDADLSCDRCGGEGFLWRGDTKNIRCESCNSLGIQQQENSLRRCKGLETVVG